MKDFPDFYVRDFGWHKIAFGIHKIDPIVLKVDAKKSIENDHRVYKRVLKACDISCFKDILAYKILFAPAVWVACEGYHRGTK